MTSTEDLIKILNKREAMTDTDMAILLNAANPNKTVVDNSVSPTISSPQNLPKTAPVVNNAGTNALNHLYNNSGNNPVWEQKLEDIIYAGIAHAETGSEDNPWIRTKAKGSYSSAFGPAQLTSSLAKEYKKKKDLFAEDEHKFLDHFIDETEKFLQHDDGLVKDSSYGYGGSGNVIRSEKDKLLYDGVVKKILSDIYKKNKGNLNKVWREWRFGGKGKNNPKNVDKSYKEKFLNAVEPYIPKKKTKK